MPTLKPAFELLKVSFAEWSGDNAPRLGAALAYYTAFSIAPLLVVVIAIAGLVFGVEAAQGQVMAQIRGLVGEAGSRTIEAMIASASEPTSGIIATVVSIVTLLLGASGVFGELQGALNTVWEVAPKPGRNLFTVVKDRFLSFTMVVGTGFLLLVSLVVSAALAALSEYLGGVLPIPPIALQAINFAISFAVVTLLFAMVLKILPDAEVAWRDVWVGAAVTALLFSIGKLAIGIYLGRSSVTSAYGAAGSFVVILLWVYYSAQILLFGAEFTQVYANRYGSRLRVEPGGVPVAEGPETPPDQQRPPAEPHAPERREGRTGRPLPAGAVAYGSILAVLGFILGLALGRRQA